MDLYQFGENLAMQVDRSKNLKINIDVTPS